MLSTATAQLATIKHKRNDNILWNVYYTLEVEYFNTYNEGYLSSMTMIQRLLQFKYSTGKVYQGLVLYVLGQLNKSYEKLYMEYVGGKRELHNQIKGYLS